MKPQIIPTRLPTINALDNYGGFSAFRPPRLSRRAMSEAYYDLLRNAGIVTPNSMLNMESIVDALDMYGRDNADFSDVLLPKKVKESRILRTGYSEPLPPNWRDSLRKVPIKTTALPQVGVDYNVEGLARASESIQRAADENIAKLRGESNTTSKRGRKLGSVMSGIARAVPTMGDMLSAYGVWKGMHDGEGLTHQAFMASPPNENHFKDYGRRSLASMDDTLATIHLQHDNAMSELERANRVNMDSIASNTSNPNTARALQQKAYADYLRGMNQATQARRASTNQLQNIRTQLLSDIDRMYMQGRGQADVSNRQDIASYYTNLGQNRADYSKGLQHLGGMYNQHHLNQVVAKLASRLSQYGFAIDKDGNVYKKG